MKKRFLALLCIAVAGLVMTGCAAGNASGIDATTSPMASESPMLGASASPETSMSPMTSPMDSPMSSPMTSPSVGTGTTSDSMTPAQAGRLAEQISTAVERLSEVDEAEVAIHNGRVLIAVEFDDQYNAGLDDRMKQMITEAVRKVDSSLTDVQITDDDTIYGQVKNLGERVGQVTGLDELADDFGDLWDRITGR